MPRAKSLTQTELITQLSSLIDLSTHQVVSSAETRQNTRLTEGEWIVRVEKFINDPINHIPNAKRVKELIAALLTKSYSNHLPKPLVAKYTKPLQEPPVKKESPAIQSLKKRGTI